MATPARKVSPGRQKTPVPELGNTPGRFRDNHLLEIFGQAGSHEFVHATAFPTFLIGGEQQRHGGLGLRRQGDEARGGALDVTGAPAVGPVILDDQLQRRVVAPLQRRHRIQVNVEQHAGRSAPGVETHPTLAVIEQFDHEARERLLEQAENRRFRIQLARRVLRITAHQRLEVGQHRRQGTAGLTGVSRMVDRFAAHESLPRTRAAMVELCPSSLMNPSASSGDQLALWA